MMWNCWRISMAFCRAASIGLSYEDLVREPEAEMRRRLQYLVLPFDENCLRFHDNARAMSSVSAGQVHKPVSGKASAHWRNCEPWLEPLESALGPVLDACPGVPNFTVWLELRG
jgi:hypothetical protein